MVGVKAWMSPSRCSIGRESGTLRPLRTRRAGSPMTTTIFGCTIAISSTKRPTHSPGEVRLGRRAFDAEGAVDDERIDPEPFEAFHQRVAGAAVEGHPLLDLRGQRRVLEHEDVGLRVAGAEHRHQLAARTVLALLHFAAHLVELADRALKVLLTYLVVDTAHRGTL